MSDDHTTSSPLGLGLGIWGLAAGYFFFYTPYAGLTKALTSGMLPGSEGPVSGFAILPAAVMATVVVMGLVLVLTGWWRLMARVEFAGLSIPVPRRRTLIAGIGDATIIGTTTMAYTFDGVSIVFMMLLMRSGVLVMSPLMDRIYHRKIRWFSWLALILSLTALSLTLLSPAGTALTVAAGLNVAAYLAGYVLRFEAMGKLAKSLDRQDNLRYFAEEQMVATPVLLLALAAFAMFGGSGQAAQQLRFGFTGMFATSMLWPALIVGALYGLLSVFGTLIYLDHSENTYAVPVNRSASLLAGVAASYGLASIFSTAPPTAWQFFGAGLLICAAFMLAIGPRLKLGARDERLILFVCSGNTCRSPMAQRLAMHEAAKRLNIAASELSAHGLRFMSAGVSARTDHPLDEVASQALERMGAPTPEHAAQSVTPELVARAEVVICLSPAHRDKLLELAPWASARVHLIDPAGAVELPADGDYDRFTTELHGHVRRCLDRLELLTA